jgi:hypothetical protein
MGTGPQRGSVRRPFRITPTPPRIALIPRGGTLIVEGGGSRVERLL